MGGTRERKDNREKSKKGRGEREEVQLIRDEERHTGSGQAPLRGEGESSQAPWYTLDVSK